MFGDKRGQILFLHFFRCFTRKRDYDNIRFEYIAKWNANVRVATKTHIAKWNIDRCYACVKIRMGGFDMDFQKVIEERRSIRKYDNTKKVTKAQIEEMLEAANYAPSWKNSQTGRYYCVISEEMIQKVRTECLPEFNQNNTVNAGALIVTTFVKAVAGFNPDGQPTNELGDIWGAYDLGLNNENLVLKAHEMGLGTLIMGIRDEKKLADILNIPETECIVAVISVGYPNIEPKMPRRKSTEERAVFF